MKISILNHKFKKCRRSRIWKYSLDL